MLIIFVRILICSFLIIVSTDSLSAQATDSNCIQVCPACPPCGEEKDLSDWQLSTSLGFSLTRGNSDTLLLNSVSKANREINDHIYNLSIDGSFGQDDNLDDEENGSTSQKKLLINATYKHLLSERIYASLGASATFDQIADIDYRYVLSPGLGVFLVKNDVVKFSVESGPSYVAEKQGGVKNDYLSVRVGQRFDWKISKSSKVFQTLELILSLEDGDDTLLTTEAGIEAAINSSMALVVTVKNIYDNLPAKDRERNDLSVISGLQVTL